MDIEPDGCLVRLWKSDRKYTFNTTHRQLVIPKTLRDEILETAHDGVLAGHQSFIRTFDRIRDRYWWPGFARDVRRYVRSCPDCQKRGSPRGKRAGLLNPVVSNRPWQCISMDIVGPLPTTAHQNRWILTFVDHFTKWAEATPLPDITAERVADSFVREIICRHSAPETILTDCGKQFTSQLFDQVNKIYWAS